MLRNITAGVIGVLVAVLLVYLVEMLGHTVYPPPPDLDIADVDAMAAYVDTLPLGAFLFVGGAWFVGTLAGTCAACAIAAARPVIFAIVVGGLMLAGAAMNLFIIPHPTWFSILGIAGIVVAAWLGTKCARTHDGATS